MGQRDIRRLLIVGAVAVVRWAARKGAPEGTWLGRMLARKPKMLVAVALAILSPRAQAAVWQTVSVTAPRAVLADALSTAGCLMPDRAALDALIAAFPGCRVEQAVPL